MGVQGAAASISYFGLKKEVLVGPGTWALGQTDPRSNLGFAIYMLEHCEQVGQPLQGPLSSASLGPLDKLVISLSVCPVNYEQLVQAQD